MAMTGEPVRLPDHPDAGLPAHFHKRAAARGELVARQDEWKAPSGLGRQSDPAGRFICGL